VRVAVRDVLERNSADQLFIPDTKHEQGDRADDHEQTSAPFVRVRDVMVWFRVRKEKHWLFAIDFESLLTRIALLPAVPAPSQPASHIPQRS
jgi:hypothetical protein